MKRRTINELVKKMIRSKDFDISKLKFDFTGIYKVNDKYVKIVDVYNSNDKIIVNKTKTCYEKGNVFEFLESDNVTFDEFSSLKDAFNSFDAKIEILGDWLDEGVEISNTLEMITNISLNEPTLILVLTSDIKKFLLSILNEVSKKLERSYEFKYTDKYPRIITVIDNNNNDKFYSNSGYIDVLNALVDYFESKTESVIDYLAL